MGTEKRERQKANRQQRLIEEARAERAGKARRSVIRWGTAVVVGVGLVILIAAIAGAFSGGGDDDTEAEDRPVITVPNDLTTTTAVPPVTYPPIPKPAVEIPADEPTELVITDLVVGDGPAAATGDTVVVHYVGVLSADGSEFDNSYDRGSPFPVTIGETAVIEGWTEGLVGVQAGGRRQLDIPAELAYGDAGAGDAIPPGAAITFVIDVLEVAAADGS